MLTFSKKPAFGLELSDISFKIVQFKKTAGQLKLVSFVKEDIPDGLVKNGQIEQEEELAVILKKALKKVKGEPLQGNRVVCNLPEEKVFIRVIQLPKMKKEEVGKAVQWEAEAHIPLKLDEVYLDWQIIEPLVDHLDHLDILVAATKRELVEKYSSFLKKAGLEPIALEPESVAVIRSLIKPKELKPTIIVDLGATGTNFVIFSALAIRFTSHIHISGQLFNQAIIKGLGVSQKEANQLKIKLGLDKSKLKGKVYQVLEPVVIDLAKQIKDYIAFYHEHATHIHGPDGTIGQVLLCGGDALLLNLATYLEQKLKLPVRIGNPLTNVSDSQKSIMSKRESLTYSIALGLGLKDFI